MEANILRALPYLDDDEIEAVILSTVFRATRPVKILKVPFRFSNLHAEYSFLNFRFYPEDLSKLKALLEIPNVVICNNGRVSGMEALCVLLRRLAYPSRYVDLMQLFGRSRSELCKIFRTMVRFIQNNWGHLLTRGLTHPSVTKEHLRSCSQAIHNKGAPYKNCVGFLDGTVRSISRPTKGQRLFYNGHRRTHALKFQSVVFPNGIVGSMYGPIQGRRHDAFMLHESKIIDEMELNFVEQNGTAFHLYGDPAYPLHKHVMVPFKGHALTPDRRQCNSRMSKVRESVEWQFGKIIKNFAYLDFKKNLRLQLQPVADFYKVATIFTNCHTCFYGSEASTFFNMSPPSIEEYLVNF